MRARIQEKISVLRLMLFLSGRGQGLGSMRVTLGHVYHLTMTPDLKCLDRLDSFLFFTCWNSCSISSEGEVGGECGRQWGRGSSSDQPIKHRDSLKPLASLLIVLDPLFAATTEYQIMSNL